jgi:hypothetical protein
MKRWIENPSYEVKIRIHLDACNSGSQFTSAIMGDKFGMNATNVLVSYDMNTMEEVRKDAYLMVRDVALKIIDRELEDKKSSFPQQVLLQ